MIEKAVEFMSAVTRSGKRTTFALGIVATCQRRMLAHCAVACMLQEQVVDGVARAVVVSVRNALHSPSSLWEVDPVGEHLACRASRSLAARTVA